MLFKKCGKLKMAVKTWLIFPLKGGGILPTQDPGLLQ